MGYHDIIISTYLVGDHGWEFRGHPEFELHQIAANNKWTDFRRVVEHVYLQGQDDVIIICYEGHHFTKDYQAEIFIDKVLRSSELGTHILIGGCKDFSNLVAIEQGLFWVNKFEQSDFYVVFSNAFRTILDISLDTDENLEEILSETLANKLLIAPFISWTGINSRADSQLALYNYIINKYHIIWDK